MGWLIRRAMVIWVILIAICAGVVGIVRANGGPDRLQALGFGMCDGEPCGRGIRPGMNWSETDRLRSDASEIGPPMVFFSVGMDETLTVILYGSYDGTAVSRIDLEADSGKTRLFAADIVQRFGYPCLVDFRLHDNGNGMMQFNYPNVYAMFLVHDSGFSLDSPIWRLQLYEPGQPNFCSIAENTEFNGPWRGFVSVDMYLARNRRDFGPRRR